MTAINELTRLRRLAVATISTVLNRLMDPRPRAREVVQDLASSELDRFGDLRICPAAMGPRWPVRRDPGRGA